MLPKGGARSTGEGAGPHGALSTDPFQCWPLAPRCTADMAAAADATALSAWAQELAEAKQLLVSPCCCCRLHAQCHSGAAAERPGQAAAWVSRFRA